MGVVFSVNSKIFVIYSPFYGIFHKFTAFLVDNQNGCDKIKIRKVGQMPTKNRAGRCPEYGGIIMGKYEVKQTEKGFRFNLKAANGQIIGVSQMYASEKSCLKGIESVTRVAPDAVIEDQTVEGFTVEKNPKFEIYLDKANEYRFRLKASNGEIIAVSDGYSSKSGAVNGIESIRKNVKGCTIERPKK